MTWAEWRFSARLAAQDPFVRWTSIATAAVFVLMSAFFMIRLLPNSWRVGVVTLHYNVYLGIDDVRSWPWLITIPAWAFALLAFDGLVAFGVHRKDKLASRTLVAIGAASTVLWAIGLFFLIVVNA